MHSEGVAVGGNEVRGSSNCLMLEWKIAGGFG